MKQMIQATNILSKWMPKRLEEMFTGNWIFERSQSSSLQYNGLSQLILAVGADDHLSHLVSPSLPYRGTSRHCVPPLRSNMKYIIPPKMFLPILLSLNLIRL